MKTTKQLAGLCALALATILSSCASTVSQPPPEPKTHVLKQGDTFIYHDYAADTAGVVIPGSDTTRTALVTRVGFSYEGKTNVTEIVKGADTVHFADAGDSAFAMLQNRVDILSGASLPAIWIGFDPSHAVQTVFDSTMNGVVSGMKARVHAIIATGYLGKRNTVIGGQSLTVYEFTKAVKVTVNVLGTDYTTTVTATYDYAPSIGYLAARNINTISDSQNSPFPNGTQYSVLKSYSIH